MLNSAHVFSICIMIYTLQLRIHQKLSSSFWLVFPLPYASSCSLICLRLHAAMCLQPAKGTASAPFVQEEGCCSGCGGAAGVQNTEFPFMTVVPWHRVEQNAHPFQRRGSAGSDLGGKFFPNSCVDRVYSTGCSSIMIHVCMCYGSGTLCETCRHWCVSHVLLGMWVCDTCQLCSRRHKLLGWPRFMDDKQHALRMRTSSVQTVWWVTFIVRGAVVSLLEEGSRRCAADAIAGASATD